MKYKLVYRPDHPKAKPNGMIEEHIVVAEEKIGRLLKKGEIVHHVDFDKDNNTPDNLFVMASRREHQGFPEAQAKYLIENGLLGAFFHWYIGEYRDRAKEAREIKRLENEIENLKRKQIKTKRRIANGDIKLR